MKMTEKELMARDAKRDIGAELLQAAQELRSGKWARKTTFEALPNGSMRRLVVRADGTIEKEEVLTGPKWELMAARAGSGLSQMEFAKAIGVSVRTLQEWEQGRKSPSGPAQMLLKIASRHPELLREVACSAT